MLCTYLLSSESDSTTAGAVRSMVASKLRLDEREADNHEVVMVYAKRARKQAEDDLRLLLNRIGLLKSEEGKVSFQLDLTDILILS